MRNYAIQRVLLLIPTLLVLSFISFALIRFIPGDAAWMMTEELGYAPDIEALQERLGLTEPIHTQYLKWVGGFFRGDFGRSLWDGSSAADELFRRLPVTLELAFFSLFLSALVAIPIGVFSAMRQDTKGDYVVRSTVVLADAIPHFWLATLILILPAVYLGWTAPVGWHSLTEDPVKHLLLLLLPASIISVSSSASLVRITRTMMLEVLRQEYIRTAWSKGLSERSVMYRHALKNALIPVVTVFGLRVPNALNGSVVMEAVFGIPGLGRWTIDAITFRDYPQLQVALLFTAITVLIANLIVDLLYGWLDPRVRYK